MTACGWPRVQVIATIDRSHWMNQRSQYVIFQAVFALDALRKQCNVADRSGDVVPPGALNAQQGGRHPYGRMFTLSSFRKSLTMSTLSITSQFDAGAIEVVSLTDPLDIRLRLRPDVAAPFSQWFYFRLQGARGQALRLVFLDMDKTAYPKGWENYGMAVSYDRQDWFRVPARFDGKTLAVEFTPEGNDAWCAYFEPYSHERHLDFVAWCSNDENVETEALGVSVEGRDLTLLTITSPTSAVPLVARRKIWLIARQHPGETMAEWAAEGFVERLLDKSDSLSRALLEQCVFHVVPRMNPDGAVRGNLRTNAKGADLNREWESPTLERSPEVFLVREKMQALGVDLFIDAHGDESLPYNFVAGCEGVPNYDGRHAALEDAFKQSWLASCPDFQTQHGYPKNAPGQANLKMATAWIGNHFRCLAFTVEMPFKDNAARPDPVTGWNGERSKALGASLLVPMWAVVEQLIASPAPDPYSQVNTVNTI